MARAVVMGRWWASNSLTWARSSSCRHPQSISRQRKLHHAAATPAALMSQTFASASASVSASVSEKVHSPGFKKPEVIEWQQNMPINNASFIGTLVRDIQIQYLDSGKIVANCSIKVNRIVQNPSWFYLEFWGDLAEVAAAHLKIYDQICVSGSVWPENVEGRDGLQKTFAKVVVKDLKFVLPRHKEEYEKFCATSVEDLKLKLDELWNDLFDNCADWIDFRGKKVPSVLGSLSFSKNRKTERHPDFKHIFTGRSLWINNRYTPDWVKERLMKEGSPGFQEQIFRESSLN